MTENEKRKKRGLSGNALRICGMAFVFCGIVGRGVVQTHMLGMKGADSAQLLEILNSSTNAMTLATFSIIMQIAETCAVPIFAMLLIEGMQNTSDFMNYFKRVLAAAVISEIPFNLVFSAKLIDLKTRNPIWGVALCMFMLYLWRNYETKGKKNALIKLFLAVITFLWCQMLRVDHGAAFVIIVSIFWVFRRNSIYLNFAGAAAAMLCSLISPFYLASPMGVLAVHSYNGVKSIHTHKYNYLMYPVLLMIGWAFGILL